MSVPVDLGDQHLADSFKLEALQAALPSPRVLRIAVTGLLLLDHLHGGFREVGDPQHSALLDERAPALAGQLPVGPRLLSRLGQRHKGDVAEPELPPPPANHEALNPASDSAGLDVEVEPVSVGVSDGRSE